MPMLKASRRVTYTLTAFWLLFCVWSAAGWWSARAHRGDFTVVAEADGYDIRSYGEAIAAQVHVNGPWSRAGDDAGRRLRAYIGGDNITQESAAASASSGEPEGAGIGASAHVVQEGRDDGSWLVSVVIPARFTDATVPRPEDPQVRIVKVPARTYAVTILGSDADAASVEHDERLLRDRLAHDRVLITGTARVARFGAPWAPPFMRRAELMIPVRP